MKTNVQNPRKNYLKVLALFLAVAVFFAMIPVSAQGASAKNLKKAKITLEYSTTVYNGKAKKPAVTVKYGTKKLKKNRDYTVTYKSNKKVGTATVVVKGKGAYKGKVKKHFKILPRGTVITSVQRGPASFLLKWKQKKVTGYQIRYSTDRTFKKGVKKIELKSSKVVSRKVFGLKENQTYYVQIRTFITRPGTAKNFSGMSTGKNYYSAWSKAKSVTTEALTKEDRERVLTKENAEIAIRILKERVKNEAGKRSNFLVSPISLYEDLAMATNGAEGETLAELENYLGLEVAKANELIARYNRTLTQNIRIANSIWANSRFGLLNPTFSNVAKQYYGAEVESVPYNQKKTVDRINNWVKKNTHNMIPSIIDRLEPNQAVTLLNAVAFEAEWETPYMEKDIDEKAKFTKADKTKEACTMLYSQGTTYMELKDAEGRLVAYGFLKPYADGQSAFLGILPVEGKTPDDVLNAMDGETYRSMYNGRKNYTDGEFLIGIPEFELDDSMELEDNLRNAGVQKVFSSEAELGKMLQSGKQLQFDSVIQKTHIEVDRHGTKAAAATAITAKATSAPGQKNLYLYLNRPFVYGIVDLETGMPFFMGVQNSIK